MLRAAVYFHMRSSFLLCHYALLLSYSGVCLSGDTLKAGEKVSENGSTLVSVGQIFELGFFSPPGNSTIYLGIWYHGVEPQTVVWVANRDNPVIDSMGVFQIAEDGNLKVLDNDGRDYWSSELEGSSTSNRTVKLMDSGNLVLIDYQSNLNLWQSFEHPTDTFLPGMKMDSNLELTSWRSSSDPGSGDFTFKQGPTGGSNYIISRNPGQLYWESGITSEINSEAISGWVVYLLTNFTTKTNQPKIPFSDYDNTRLLMNSTGHIQVAKRIDSSNEWSLQWEEPKNLCKIYNFCGNFSSCNAYNRYICKCLPGFTPKSPDIYGGYFRNDQGCVRRPATCGESTYFINLMQMKVSNPSTKLLVNETECRSECRKLCPRCQAYSYVPADRSSSYTCWLWTQDLTTLEEQYQHSGGNLSIRVDTSSIELTPRTCELCGTNIIPYPLSTGPNCGDPMYSGFNCDYTTAQVRFVMQGRKYRVAAINPTEMKFFINTENSYCNNNISRARNEQIDVSYPYILSKECYGEDEIGVTWRPPPEPTCRNPIDCRGWANSTCNVKKGNRCLCNTNYEWNSSIFSCTLQHQEDTPLSGTKEPLPTTEGHSKISLSLILVITLISIIFLVCTIISVYLWRKKMARKQDGGRIQRIRGRFYDSERQVKDLIDLEGLEEKDTEGIGVPYFDFESILEATANFSDANKLGRGGYGPVYKGMFPGGQAIAVKRLSSVSSQGLKEFKNEVVLIAKLQHRNLVRLRDFGLARIFGSKETEANTERVVGTYGYMSPEYALDGLFSIKSDVFSFGVVLLEIISGKKNTGFYQSKQISSLLGYAWRLWTENKLMDLMDPSLRETCSENQFIRCAHISLLCVQDEPGDRPTMSNVVTMLDNETTTLPIPKQPTFFMKRALSSTASSSSKPEIGVQFDTTYGEGR
ncbi:hypothetical protein L6164_018791 [Bauhinia variegata]|uniref:Uncharacterized protein n=1 Tax=Bauhinia variegata TaxID=167791 RepID=A0ACB9NEB6_BAUVA|nr:hypothetical protein L6164_018791 [Bauhinia variegata]